MTEGLMDVGHVIPEAIRELLEKRGTFQEWLARLDELGNEFRPEVADKVRSDYASRLGEVETELEGHRAELETALADRTGAVEKVAAEHDSRSAELEETQLRHVVGEFDDEEWERRRAKHQVQIDELEADLTAQRSAVDSLQTVLSELTGQAAVISFSDAIEAEAPILDEAAVAEEEPPEADAEPMTASWMAQTLAGDELPEAEPAEVVDDVVRAELVEADVVARDFADAELVEAEVVGADSEPEEGAAAELPDEVEAVAEPVLDQDEPGDFIDELEFLESLSLDDADNFDAVSAMLDEDDGDSGADGESKRETGDL
jgi:hypothetical protein